MRKKINFQMSRKWYLVVIQCDALKVPCVTLLQMMKHLGMKMTSVVTETVNIPNQYYSTTKQVIQYA